MKTKIFLILMAFVLGITQVHVSSATEIGDINNDTKVTSVDALLALQIAVGIIPQEIVADVSCDGKVTSLDALMILQKSVGLIELQACTFLPLNVTITSPQDGGEYSEYWDNILFNASVEGGVLNYQYKWTWRSDDGLDTDSHTSKTFTKTFTLKKLKVTTYTITLTVTD
ncbi:MAG: dockerin type I repeat-containing protein, partial [Methanosarcinales archaeon]